MADVFISYAREDRDFVATLAQGLELAGLSVWWDREIGGGAEFSRTIEEELVAARTVIVLWSEHSLASHWVRDEADFAREGDKLLPLSLDGAIGPLGFRQLHAISFSSEALAENEQSLIGLLKALGVERPLEGANDGGGGVENPGVGKPGLVVLPFQALSQDEELGYLAEGIGEDVTTSLSGISHIRVIAGERAEGAITSNDVRRIGEEMNGCHYVVEGSVRITGSRLRVTSRLHETATGENIWARRFDQDREEFNDNPDDLVEKIGGNVFNQLLAADAERAANLPIEELGAWEYCQRAWRNIPKWSGLRGGWKDIQVELDAALALKPDYGFAHAIKSWGAMSAYINGLYDTDEEMNELLKTFNYHLKKARALAKSDALTLTYIGAAENYSGQQDAAIHTLEQVLAAVPSNAEAWACICMPYAYTARYDDARRAISRANELAMDQDYQNQIEWYGALVEFLDGKYAISKPMAERSTQRMPDYAYCHVIAAMTCALTNDPGEADRHMHKVRRANPDMTPGHLSGMILTQQDKEKAEREMELMKELWW